VLVDLPATIWINGYPMMLLECDRFTLRYRNKGNIASLLSIDSVHEKIKHAVGDGLDGIRANMADSDATGNGEIYLDSFVQALDKYDTQLDEDEIMALVQHWDTERNGLVKFDDFLRAVADA